APARSAPRARSIAHSHAASQTPRPPRGPNRRSPRAAQSAPWEAHWRMVRPRRAIPQRSSAAAADAQHRTGPPPPAAEFSCVAKLFPPLPRPRPLSTSSDIISCPNLRRLEHGSIDHRGRAGPLLASTGGRARPVRPVPALLQAARRPARPVLRARAPRRPNLAHHVRPLLRLLHRSDREEAAQSLSPRHAGAVVWHGRLQPDLQVLSELGHFESARARPRPGPRLARGDRASGG